MAKQLFVNALGRLDSIVDLFLEKEFLYKALFDYETISIQRSNRMEALKKVFPFTPFYHQSVYLNTPFENWPTIDRVFLRENEDALICRSTFSSQHSHIQQSTGTTGTPIRVHHSHFSTSYWQVQHRVHFSIALSKKISLSPFSIGVVLTNIQDALEYKIRCPLMNFTRLFKFNIAKQQPQVVIQKLKELRPQYISADPSVLNEIVDLPDIGQYAGAFQCPIFSSGETLSATTRQKVADAFNVDVYDRYASTEFFQIGFECDQHSGFHVDDLSLIVEIMDFSGNNNVPDGEIGEIVITSLRNLVQPLVRYRTGDIGVLERTPCACGIRLPRVVQFSGRTIQLFKKRNGKLIVPYFLMNKFGDLPILKWRLVQTDINHFDVYVLHSTSTRSTEYLSNQTKIQRRFENVLTTLMDDSVTVRLLDFPSEETVTRKKMPLFERTFH